MDVSLLKLALSIWPMGLTDSRVMHNLLFCLVNLTADSSLINPNSSANDIMREHTHLSLRPVVGKKNIGN